MIRFVLFCLEQQRNSSVVPELRHLLHFFEIRIAEGGGFELFESFRRQTRRLRQLVGIIDGNGAMDFRFTIYFRLDGICFDTPEPYDL